MRRLIKPLILICIGGITYILIELLWRGRSHWTMFIVGGICSYDIGLINELIPWNMPLWKQSLIGSTVTTIIEFISGCIINIGLGWNVWDYSDLPFNILGQVCIPFFFLWMILATIWIIADDNLRYVLFKEEKPHYVLW